MKAIVYTQYGSPDVLQLKEVENPTPKDDEVLIRVRAATVTSGDCNMRGFVFVPPGFGPLPRLMFGLTKPRKTILGTELAGDVAAVGRDVKRFKEGDAVFGIGSSELGAYAEYACRKADGPLALKPANMSYAEAAAVSFGAGTALHFLRDRGKIQAGQKILVNGASGGTGTYAVQLARYYGAEVTAVCSGANVEWVRSLGANRVIDYAQEDFAEGSERYDMIFDSVVGKTSFSRARRILKPGGRYLAVAGGLKEMLQTMSPLTRDGKKVIAGGATENKEDQIFLAELIEAGKIKVVIDRCYPLEETAEAHRYVDTGRKKGSVVITVAHD